MNANSPNTPKRSAQSTDGEKTPESGAPHAKRYLISPSLQAFYTFEESLAQFTIHISTKIDHIGTGTNIGTEHSSVRTDLERMGEKCERMKREFERFISELDKAITNYEKKKPNDLPESAGKQKRSPSFKIQSAHGDMFTALNKSLGNIGLVIRKKINKSIYDDQYSISLEKKLKKLKEMCESKKKILEETGEDIKDVIKKLRNRRIPIISEL